MKTLWIVALFAVWLWPISPRVKFYHKDTQQTWWLRTSTNYKFLFADHSTHRSYLFTSKTIDATADHVRLNGKTAWGTSMAFSGILDSSRHLWHVEVLANGAKVIERYIPQTRVTYKYSP